MNKDVEDYVGSQAGARVAEIVNEGLDVAEGNAWAQGGAPEQPVFTPEQINEKTEEGKIVEPTVEGVKAEGENVDEEGDGEVNGKVADETAADETSVEKEFDPAIPSTPDEAKSFIRRVVEKTKNFGGRVFRRIIGRITQRQANNYLRIGVSVDNDYVHSVENTAIVHNQQEHGNPAKESRVGQIAIVEDDYLLIPDILENYDSVVKSPNKDKLGNEILIYEKKYPDGTIYYLEEVRTGRKSLSFKTIYKRKNGTGSSGGLMPTASPSTPLAPPDISNSESKDSGNIPTGQGNGGENVVNVDNAPSDGAVADRYDEMPMQMKSNGQASKNPDWERATPLRAYDFIYVESGDSRDVANSFVRVKIDESRKALEKLEKSKPEYGKRGIGSDRDKYAEAMEKWESEVDRARKAVDYWNAVAQHAREELAADQRNAADEAVLGNRIKKYDEPNTLVDLVMRELFFMRNGLVWRTKDERNKKAGDYAMHGVAHHMGYGSGERRGLQWLFGSEESGAVTPEVFAHRLWESYGSGENGIPEFTADEAFQTVLDVLGSISNRRDLGNQIVDYHERAEKEMERAEREAADDWAQQQAFNDYDEYQAYQDYQNHKDLTGQTKKDVRAMAELEEEKGYDMTEEDAGVAGEPVQMTIKFDDGDEMPVTSLKPGGAEVSAELTAEIKAMSNKQLLDNALEQTNRPYGTRRPDTDPYLEEYDRRPENRSDYDQEAEHLNAMIERGEITLEDAYEIYGNTAKLWQAGGYRNSLRSKLRAQLEVLENFIEEKENDMLDWRWTEEDMRCGELQLDKAWMLRDDLQKQLSTGFVGEAESAELQSRLDLVENYIEVKEQEARANGPLFELYEAEYELSKLEKEYDGKIGSADYPEYERLMEEYAVKARAIEERIKSLRMQVKLQADGKVDAPASHVVGMDGRPADIGPTRSTESAGGNGQQSGQLDELAHQHRQQKQQVHALGYPLETLKLRKLEEGETCLVERRYTENGFFGFTSRTEKVESVDDVAYIFKQLENAAVENCFLVLVKDGEPTVIHIGTGDYGGTIGATRTAIAAASAIKPDKVWLVHNHPSGILKASNDDANLLGDVRAMFGRDVAQEGIIIDTVSGEYALFDTVRNTNIKDMPVGGEGDIPVKVYSFSKQVFDKDFDPKGTRMNSSVAVAEFVSSHRLGERDKISVLILNNQAVVTGNIFLPVSKLEDITPEMVDNIAADVNMMGGNHVILYGRYNIFEDGSARSKIKSLSNAFVKKNIRLLDVLDMENNSANEVSWVREEGLEGRGESEVERRQELTEKSYSEGNDVEYVNDDGVSKTMRIHTPATEVELIEPTVIVQHNKSRDELLEMYKSLSPETNENTGETVIFYNSAFGKNHREGGLFEKIVPQIRDLFKGSKLIYSEPEQLAGTTRRDGRRHKEHRDVIGYGNYLNKVIIDGKEYWVRFTIQRKKGESGLHSSFVTNVDLYNNPVAVAYDPASNGRGRLDYDRITDAKLKLYFEKSKEIEENISDVQGNGGENNLGPRFSFGEEGSESGSKTAGNPTPEGAENVKVANIVIGGMRRAGFEVNTDKAEGQRVLDSCNKAVKLHQAYHGSGADFDEFDHAHMGEGEGNRVYGYGTYLTEVEGIGKTYAHAASGNQSVYYKGEEYGKGGKVPGDSEVEQFVIKEVVDRMRNRGESAQKVIGDLLVMYEHNVRNWRNSSDREKARRFEQIYEVLSNLNPSDFTKEEKTPILYTVEVPDDNGKNYIHFEKEMSFQEKKRIYDALYEKLTGEGGGYSGRVASEELRKELDELMRMESDGKDVYGNLTAYLGGDKYASEFLHDIGYVGMSYPTEYRSGGRSDGSRNFLMFDEGDMKITDKMKLFMSPDGKTAYGYVVGNKIYIDPDYLAEHPETPLHELQHIVTEAYRKAHPERWRKLVKYMKKNLPELWDEVKRRYGFEEDGTEAAEDMIADEVMSFFSGSRGTERIREAMREAGEDGDVLRSAAKRTVLRRILDWLKAGWNWFAEKFGLPVSVSPEDVADMTLRDLAERSGVDGEGDGGVNENINNGNEIKRIPTLEENRASISQFKERYGGSTFYVITEEDGIKGLMSQPFWDESWTEEEAKDFLYEIYYGAGKDNLAGVLGFNGEFLIFADKDFDKYSIENTLFHENIHSYFQNNKYENNGNNIYDHYWDAVSELPESKVLKESVQKAYKKDEWHEEYFTFRLARAMENGDFSRIIPYLSAEDVKVLDNLLNSLNYDKQKESVSRRSRRRTSSIVLENRPERLDESPRGDEAAREEASFSTRMGESVGKEEGKDRIKFSLAGEDGSESGSGTAGNPTSGGEGGGQGPEDNGGGRGGRRSGADFLDNIVSHARENIARARAARERAMNERTEGRARRERAVNNIFGEGGIVNDENITPAARAHIGSDMIRGIADIRKILKTGNMETEEKVKAITETLIPLMGGLSRVRRYDAERILRGINRGMAKNDVEKEVWKAVDIVLGQYERDVDATTDKLLKTPVVRLNDRRMRVQGRVDVDSGRVLKSFKKYMGEDKEVLAQRRGELLDIIDNEGTSAVKKAEAERELDGLEMAQRYQEEVMAVKREREDLMEQKRRAQERIYDFEEVEIVDDEGNVVTDEEGNVKTTEKMTLKEEFKPGKMTEENKRVKQETQELIDAIDMALIENRIEYVNAGRRFNEELGGVVGEGKSKAKDFREEQKERRDDILYDAHRDLEGVEALTTEETNSNTLTQFKRMMYSPLRTFVSFMKVFGRRYPQGEGRLFDRFVRQYIDASSNEWLMKEADYVELDQKAKEIAGVDKWDDLPGLCKKNDKKNPLTVTFIDNGKEMTKELSTANALYIYAVDKQTDGRMKLRATKYESVKLYGYKVNCFFYLLNSILILRLFLQIVK